MSIPESAVLEYRLRKLFFHQGFFSRSHLTLRSYFYPESVDVTDIDVLGIRFSINFNPEVAICECKSGESNGIVDRILWLSGLSRYLAASSSLVVRKTIPARIKRFAQEVNVVPIDYVRLGELEKQIGIPSEFLGSCDFDYYEPRIQKYYHSIKEDPQLSKVYWFLRSRFWFTDNPTRMKQTITALDMLAKNPKPDSSRWLIYEASILLSLSLVYLCQEIFSFSESERSEYIRNLLTTGVGSPEFSKKVLDATYGIVLAMAKEKSGEIEKVDYEKLRIPPPEYESALTDLAFRMLQRPTVSIQIPRFLDFVCHEFLFRKKKVEQDSLRTLFPLETDMLTKLAKNIAKFIIDKKGIPQEHFSDLMTI